MTNILKVICFLLVLILPIGKSGAAVNGFEPLGQFYLYRGSPAGFQISEMTTAWGYGTDKVYLQQTDIPGGWEESPNLLEAPYGLPSCMRAVQLTIKAKVKTVKWSSYDSLGNLQIAIRSPDNQGPTNEIVHAFSAKVAGYGNNLPGGGLVTEDLNIQTAAVGVVNGVFQMYTALTVGPYVTVDRVVYISGFWC